MNLHPAIQGVGIVCVTIVLIAAVIGIRRIVFGPRDRQPRRGNRKD